uniref:Uncharacterized protein n=1 Tax=Arundo donax TaxID=35708 RepID=A0A0A9CKX3_ARUDO
MAPNEAFIVSTRFKGSLFLLGLKGWFKTCEALGLAFHFSVHSQRLL